MSADRERLREWREDAERLMSTSGYWTTDLAAHDYVPRILGLLDALDAAEQEKAALVARIEAVLATGPDTWTPYESRDTGLTFLQESVLDFCTDLRAALTDAPHHEGAGTDG